MICLNEFDKNESPSRVAFGQYVKLLAPFAPHMAEEIWRNVLGNKTSIHREPWPEYDPQLLVSDTFTLVIQVNGRTRDTVEVPTGTAKEQAIEFALGSPRAKQYIGATKLNEDKIIYVPERLINIVL